MKFYVKTQQTSSETVTLNAVKGLCVKILRCAQNDKKEFPKKSNVKIILKRGFFMLKHIPETFTPDLLKLLMEMGHGEELLIADGNFPQKAVSSKNIKCEVIYMPLRDISVLLKDILYFFPLDAAVEYAASAMDLILKERGGEYKNMIEENGSKLELVDRFRFYDLAEKAAGIIVTADATKGGNILIKKGVVASGGTH